MSVHPPAGDPDPRSRLSDQDHARRPHRPLDGPAWPTMVVHPSISSACRRSRRSRVHLSPSRDRRAAERRRRCDRVVFDPLDRHRLPAICTGIYLGGGFPEVHAAELSANASLRRALRKPADQRRHLDRGAGPVRLRHGRRPPDGGRHPRERPDDIAADLAVPLPSLAIMITCSRRGGTGSPAMSSIGQLLSPSQGDRADGWSTARRFLG